MTEDRRPRHGAPDYRADVRQNPGTDDSFSAFSAAPPSDAETTRFEAPRPSFDPSWPPRRDASWPEPAALWPSEEQAAPEQPDRWTGEIPRQRTGDEYGSAYPVQDDGYGRDHSAGYNGYDQNEAYPGYDAYSPGHDGGYPADHDAYAPDGEGYERDAYPHAFGQPGGAYEDAYGSAADGPGPDVETYPRDGAGLAMNDGSYGPGSETYEQSGADFGVEADPYGRHGSGLDGPESDPWVGRAGAAEGGRLAEAETALFAGPWSEENGAAGETAMIDLSAPRAEPRSHREGNRRRAGIVALAAAGVFLAGAAGYIVLRPSSSSSPSTAAVATSAPAETAPPTEEAAPVAEPTTTAPSASASPASTSASPTTAAPTTEAATTQPAAPVAPVTVKPSATTPAARPTTATPAPTKTLVPAPTTSAAAPLTAVYGFDNGDSGYVGTVTVNNPNSTAVTDWQVRLTIPSGATISVLSGGVSASAGGSRVTFSGSAIGARNSVTFTFGMESDGDDLPSGCTINGNACS
ncbi:hypothetical protein ACQPZJ_39820 [Actinoplanes sp. CA-054009]